MASSGSAPKPDVTTISTVGNGGGGRTALLTGATGFIGSHLLEHLLLHGWNVHAVVRTDESRRLLEDFARTVGGKGRFSAFLCSDDPAVLAAQVAEVGPDVLFHLASLFLVQHTPADVARLIESNILFGTRLVEACIAAGCLSVVHAGTSWQHYQDEDFNPVNLYASTKQAFHDILAYYARALGLRHTALHLYETYGLRDKRPKLIHLLMKTAKGAGSLDMSAGEQVLHLVHVDDVVRAFATAAEQLHNAERGSERTYALASRQACTIRELVAVVEDVVGQRLAITWGARPYRFREVMQPWSKGASLPGWAPEVDLRDGLRQIWEQEILRAT